MKITRRGFLKWFSALGIVSASYAGVIEPLSLKIKKYNLVTKKWPTSYPDLKIAAVGDLHVGCPSVSIERTQHIVQEINAIEPDIIFLLGDFLTSGVLGGNYIAPQPIAQALSLLKAQYGVFAVLGNHDWRADGKEMWTQLEYAGIKVLENSSVMVEATSEKNFWVSGLADDSTRKPDLLKTLSNVTTDDPVLMLSHDPASFITMNDRPVLTLSGHTHGGQMALPLIGPVIIPGRAPLKYAYGHIKEGNRDLIVTSGVGTSVLPIRAFAVPELLEIHIQAV
jgi:uncharacterized protein